MTWNPVGCLKRSADPATGNSLNELSGEAIVSDPNAHSHINQGERIAVFPERESSARLVPLGIGRDEERVPARMPRRSRPDTKLKHLNGTVSCDHSRPTRQATGLACGHPKSRNSA
jgi:hypothetical protein